jgi:hypothetical protein
MATPKLKAPPPTLAISKTFVYSSFDVINDHKMKEWVRSLAMELIRRLVTDRKQVVFHCWGLVCVAGL